MIDHTFGHGWRAKLMPLLFTFAVVGGALTFAFTS